MVVKLILIRFLTQANTKKLKRYILDEMYHALIGRNKGVVENLLNEEMLPIFMKKIASLDLNKIDPSLASKATTFRLPDTKKLLKFLNSIRTHFIKSYSDIKKQGYILSTLEATVLFETYQKGKAQIKTEIDNDANRVITGNITLEDLIQKYEATPEQGSKIIKRQIRKLF